MEERIAKIHINKAGGTAGKTSKNYRVSIPSTWIKQLGITEECREVCIQFDNEKIIITKMTPTDYDLFRIEAKKKNHKLIILFFYYNNTLCTKICADTTIKKIAIKNEVTDVLLTAFGVEQNPTWEDYNNFLQERCIPKSRDGINYYLKELGLETYDPLNIIRKTKGRMTEDNHWIKIIEG